MTKAYTNAFHFLPTPLEMINNYLHNNLIADSDGVVKQYLINPDDQEELRSCTGCSSGCYLCTLYSNFNPKVPIPKEIMSQFLDHLRTACEVNSKAKKKAWEKRISLLETTYYHFVNEVCTPPNDDSNPNGHNEDSKSNLAAAHMQRYAHFIGLMSQDPIVMHYCLHHII